MSDLQIENAQCDHLGRFSATLTSDNTGRVTIRERIRTHFDYTKPGVPPQKISTVEIGWWSGGGNTAEMIELLQWAEEIKQEIEA